MSKAPYVYPGNEIVCKFVQNYLDDIGVTDKPLVFMCKVVGQEDLIDKLDHKGNVSKVCLLYVSQAISENEKTFESFKAFTEAEKAVHKTTAEIAELDKQIADDLQKLGISEDAGSTEVETVEDEDEEDSKTSANTNRISIRIRRNNTKPVIPLRAVGNDNSKLRSFGFLPLASTEKKVELWNRLEAVLKETKQANGL